MSVSVTKSGFNVREKLKQLQKPIGLKGSELMRAETAQEARDFVSAGRKNLIINGGMEVSQRGTGAGNAASAGQVVSCDQWKSWINGGGGTGAAFTLQQEFSVIPDNFITSLKVNQTGTATLTGVNYNLIANYIEGYRIAHLGFGTAAAKTVTLSFWIRSSITGTFGGALSNTAQNRSYPFSYTIDNVNTWERKTITIPGDTTGTWARDNSRGFLIFFSLGTGPGYSGPEGVWAGATYLSATGVNNWVGQSSTFYLTGVQLEVGRNATEFEHRSYGEELALCHRYYQYIGTLTLHTWSHQIADSSGMRIQQWTFPGGPMRTTPTATYYDAASGGNLNRWAVEDPDRLATNTNITISMQHNNQMSSAGFKYPGSVSNFSLGQSGVAIAYRMELSAEL